jgi:hypothetical protein
MTRSHGRLANSPSSTGADTAGTGNSEGGVLSPLPRVLGGGGTTGSAVQAPTTASTASATAARTSRLPVADPRCVAKHPRDHTLPVVFLSAMYFLRSASTLRE